ncbi:MAG TPA: mechanosensitive ion channel protein [Syntrophus sp. (in: bacteria)]|jgi:small conductance mechanosensitive channel|nr:mechanosensitive ion channel protein [Syntrophus sp. (in: bacteria)]
MEGVFVKVQELVALYGLKVIAALAILVLGRWAAKGVQKLTARILRRHSVDPAIVSFTDSLVYVAMMTFVVLAALAQLGIQTTSFIAVIGAAGLAIGLALQASLANFAAGFLMLIFKPFKIGDYVEGGGASGSVEKIQIFTTQLATVDNKVIIIPNSKMMGDNIVNYSAKPIRRVDLDFGVSYGDEIDKVRKAIQSVVEKESRILKDPEAAILVKKLAESSVDFQLRAWVKTEDYWGVYFDVIEAVKKEFDAQGISIPFPQRDVRVFTVK